MTAAYHLTPNALEGFRRVAFYVEDGFGFAVADRVVDEIESAFEHLAANPRIGHRRQDLTSDEHVLFWSVGRTLIAYRCSSEGVEILFVERGELDWQRILKEGDERV